MLLDSEAELCTSVEPKINRVGGSRTVQLNLKLNLQFLFLPGTNFLEQKFINAEVIVREGGAKVWTRKMWGRSWGC